MAKRAYFSIDVRDLFSDTDLAKCSPSTKGIWTWVLGHMHLCGATGVLEGNADELARLCACTAQQFREAANELQRLHAANVEFLSNGTIRLINRRMLREHTGRKAGAERVRQYRNRLAGRQPLSQRPLAPRHDLTAWPLSVQMVCQRYPNTDEYLVSELIQIARTHVPSITDAQLTHALTITHAPNQRSSGLWRSTLPLYMRVNAHRLQRENLPTCQTCQGAGTIVRSDSAQQDIPACDLWRQVKQRLASTLSPGAFENWISQTVLHSYESEQITVRVPDVATEEWIRQEYAPHIRAVIRDLHLPVRDVFYTVSGNVRIPCPDCVVPLKKPPSGVPATTQLTLQGAAL